METDRIKEGGGKREEGGFQGSSVSFPGMQPWDRLPQRESRKAERLLSGRPRRCILALSFHPLSSSGPGYLGPREEGGHGGNHGGRLLR